MTPENTIAHDGRTNGCRTCVRLRRRAKMEGLTVAEFPGRRPAVRQQNSALRQNLPGRLLARGRLDYDVAVTRRCEHCGGVFDAPLADAPACPHCHRYAA
jgi:hypothetical protein